MLGDHIRTSYMISLLGTPDRPLALSAALQPDAKTFCARRLFVTPGHAKPVALLVNEKVAFEIAGADPGSNEKAVCLDLYARGIRVVLQPGDSVTVSLRETPSGERRPRAILLGFIEELAAQRRTGNRTQA